MKRASVRAKPLVLTRQMIRVLSDASLIHAVGGDGVLVKVTQGAETCGDCAQ